MKTVTVWTGRGAVSCRVYGGEGPIVVTRALGASGFAVVHVQSGKQILAFDRLGDAKTARSRLLELMPRGTWERPFEELGASPALKAIVDQVEKSLKGPRDVVEAMQGVVAGNTEFVAREEAVVRGHARPVTDHDEWTFVQKGEDGMYPIPPGEWAIRSGDGGMYIKRQGPS